MSPAAFELVRPLTLQEISMSPTGKARLDADEERVTRAQHRLIQLGAALVQAPFDTHTHARLREFLDRDVAAALASLDTLLRRPEAEVRARIAELSGHRLTAGGTE